MTVPPATGLALALMAMVLMVNTRAGVDVPPPGARLNTVTLAVPAAAMSEGGMAAVRTVPETQVVTRSAPFHLTTELVFKPVPFTVNVKPASPAVLLSGFRPLVVGTRLFTVKSGVPLVDARPCGAGFWTNTVQSPGVDPVMLKSHASWPELTNTTFSALIVSASFCSHAVAPSWKKCP